MKNAFVTYLATDDFLPGVVALRKSLTAFGNHTKLLVLYTSEVSIDVVHFLVSESFWVKQVDEIKNPKTFDFDTKFNYTYNKLNIFNLTEFKKIIFLDADLLVCNNIECLFDRPHMSAVAAGNIVVTDWVNLNSGMLVVSPDQALFEEMLELKNVLQSNGGDQGFLQSFYKEWPMNKTLHLNPRFNVPFIFLKEYTNSICYFNYSKKKLETDIFIIHFWGEVKPWQINFRSLDRKSQDVNIQALFFWNDMFKSEISIA
ncbi:glycosyltransferase [Mucilaginibacter gilvus]|uniref:Glycosyltransferase family 8 protein n=1 Tax=Mucilaginibacter gilvus TaxID=2305909 RepID=A0A444MJB9_9SPHI|nr:glycosyltransferase [Mucilaginibacter gilvus]RWY48325.1 hypothetical protein EPL05_19475 [Mucilaginibacter gilvus]